MKRVVLVFLMIIMIITTIFVTYTIGQVDKKQNKVNIVTSFYPIYIATINLTRGIDEVEVTNLTNPISGCLHDYQISPTEMIKLNKSDAFIINGAGMENFIDKIIKENTKLNLIDSSINISLIEGEEEFNSHMWLSIPLHIKQIENIKEGLITLDPNNKEKYEENAKKYIEKLNNLYENMKKELEGITHENIVIFHEAFSYLAKDLNLNVVQVIEAQPGISPSANQIKEIIEDIKKYQVKVIYTEPQYNADIANTISKETNVKVDSLDSFVTGTYEYDAYINVMQKNIQILKGLVDDGKQV